MDEYARKARLYPAVLVALPIAILGVAAFPSPPTWWKGILGLLGSGAVLQVASQFGRTFGRRKQDDLFKAWGGPPTTELLRFENATNKTRITQLHKDVEQATGLKLPDEASERKDPEAADEVYSLAAERLRGYTRDQKRFPLVFEENCNYGFRRNMFGLRPLGIVVAGFSSILAVVLTLLVVGGAISGFWLSYSVAAGLDLILLVGWISLVSGEWVKECAWAYADRLLEAAAPTRI